MASPLKVVDLGKTRVNDLIVGDAVATTWWVILYTNVVTITDATVWADLTEAAFAGYARGVMGTFSPVAIVFGHAVSTAADVTFTNSSGADVTVLGRGILRSPGPTLYAANNFPSPITIPDGGTLVISSTLSDTTEF